MRRIRIGIIGGGSACDWAVLPALSGPDAAAPPDSGIWWGRRVAATTDIAYQPPARVELVAIADDNVARLYRTAAAWRIRAPYTDWRTMLREASLDAIVAAPAMDEAETTGRSRADLIKATAKAELPLWFYDVPAATSEELEALGEFPHLWCARPMRTAIAHRTARRLIESGRLGATTALALRWPRSLCLDPTHSPQGFASSYAAFDFLLWAASLPPRDAQPVTPHAARVVLDENGGAASLWVHFSHGFEGRALAATGLFAASDDWNSASPRMEWIGSQGKSVVCEGGRSTVLLEPGEAGRTLEAPGMAPQVSHSNVIGIAEDLKEWLTHIAQGAGAPARRGRAAEHSSANAAATLRLMEAASEALEGRCMVESDLRRNVAPRELETRPTGAAGATSRAPVDPLLRTLRLPLEERV